MYIWEAKARRRDWHTWYAWRPVRLEEGGWVWLEHVRRQWVRVKVRWGHEVWFARYTQSRETCSVPHACCTCCHGHPAEHGRVYCCIQRADKRPDDWCEKWGQSQKDTP